MSKITKEIKTKNESNGMLEIKCSVTENKNACNRTRNWDMTKEITSGLEDISIGISRPEMAKTKKYIKNMEMNIEETWDNDKM